MTYQERTRVPASAPFLHGHFPGDPIVPAVVILDLVLDAIRRWKGTRAVRTIASVKFQAPLRPEVLFTVELRDAGERVIGFACRTKDCLLAAGKVELSRRD